jgi:His-Xaa-Ser system radical SAM maturase HxsC
MLLERIVGARSIPSSGSSVPVSASRVAMPHMIETRYMNHARTNTMRAPWPTEPTMSCANVMVRATTPVDKVMSCLVLSLAKSNAFLIRSPSSFGIALSQQNGQSGQSLLRTESKILSSIAILDELGARLPETNIHMLTNGRRFAWPHFVEQFVAHAHPRLTVCIPLYSDNAPEHDYVVQARGAFDQTIQGLHRLARHDQSVEIRVVLHKLTIPRLQDLAQFIYRNLTFANHIALMGLEITGFTRPNLNKLWIDPYEYQTELHRAVEYLSIRGMNVSIYNHPLCLLPRDLWKFARRSISDWKNVYFEVCENCGVRGQCGGFFMSAARKHSQHLRPIVRSEDGPNE